MFLNIITSDTSFGSGVGEGGAEGGGDGVDGIRGGVFSSKILLLFLSISDIGVFGHVDVGVGDGGERLKVASVRGGEGVAVRRCKFSPRGEIVGEHGGVVVASEGDLGQHMLGGGVSPGGGGV